MSSSDMFQLESKYLLKYCSSLLHLIINLINLYSINRFSSRTIRIIN